METRNEPIKGYKGFDKNLQCRGFQYEIGKEYETDKKPVRCAENGFHLCENPLDVLNYYPLNNDNKYCEVEGSGEVSCAEDQDSKIAVQKIKIKTSISILDIIKVGVDIILKKVRATTGDSAHAATTGNSAYAATTGNYAHAATTGNSAHAATTGFYAHAATTGDSAHAATTGDSAHAATTGYNTIAAALGRNNKAKAELNSWIVLSEYDDEYKLICVKTAKVDGKKILPNTWYKLKKGEFIKSE
jgi:hypothetical protein